MIDLDMHGVLCLEEHVQPGDLVGYLEYYQCEHCAEETLE